MQQLIQHIKLGTLFVCKSTRARQYRLSLKPDGALTLTIPRGGSLERALKFAEEKKDWIGKARKKTEQFAGNISRFSVPSFLQFTNIYINLMASGGHTFRVREQDSCYYTIYCPGEADTTTTEFQDKIRQIITGIFRSEAITILPERLAVLSEQHHLPFRNVSVKKMSSRWGSCSQYNDIHLNVHLTRLPQRLSDYTLLHELAHTRHKHHGPSFHEYLNKLTDGHSKELSKELKQYHPDRF